MPRVDSDKMSNSFIFHCNSYQGKVNILKDVNKCHKLEKKIHFNLYHSCYFSGFTRIHDVTHENSLFQVELNYVPKPEMKSGLSPIGV